MSPALYSIPKFKEIFNSIALVLSQQYQEHWWTAKRTTKDIKSPSRRHICCHRTFSFS